MTQLCFLVHNWQMALDDGKHVQSTFLDSGKAYDRVSIPALLSKLSSLGFRAPALEWLSSFLKERHQSVRVNGLQSSWQSPKSGEPKGTVLGPVLVLFLIFINDLPQRNVKNGCPLFADDTTAYAVGRDALTTCSNLTKNLDAVCTWAANWGMIFNAEKSDDLCLCNKFRLEQVGPLSRLSMTGQPVPMSKTKSKHLGVLLNR